ncbi:MAG TPA: condensation domain-containing protein [Candidatus Limnocylindrales bacterium]|nr:condensation domain-containing protein [Candidatus Limnocylindrales bacterium]
MSISLAVRGEASGPMPLAWGQSAIWMAIERYVPYDHYFNFARTLVLPDRVRPAPIPQVTAALESVVSRHSSLRTRIVPGHDDADVRQLADGEGRLPVVIGADADSLTAQLTAERFDYTAEYPLRVGLVVDGDGKVEAVVLAFCHLAADGHGAEIVVRDLRLALLGRTGLEPGSVAETVAHQHSARGRAESEAVVGFWAEAYRRMPASMFPKRRAEPQQVRYWVARLTSPALELAGQALAARHRVSTTAVLMAATAAVVCEDSGQPVAAILPIVSNRFAPEHRDLVTTLAQEGLFVLDTARAGSFGELVGLAWQASLKAYRVGLCDPRALEAALARVSRERGETVHPYCCFNDMRLVEPEARAAPAERVRAAKPLTRLEWAPPQARVNCRFCLHVTSEGEAMVLQLTGDTAYLPPDRLMGMLSTLEQKILEAVE